MCCSSRLWQGWELWPLVVCDELNCWLCGYALLCVLDVRVLHRKEFVWCQLFQQTARNTWGMLFWRVRYVILCVYVLSSVLACMCKRVCDCVCVGRMFVTVKIMIPLLCFLQLLQWTESIATTMINPRSSCVSLCAHTQTCNCHTPALSVWASRIDCSAIETPVRSFVTVFCSLLPPLTASFCFFEMRWNHTHRSTHARTHAGWINQVLHLYRPVQIRLHAGTHICVTYADNWQFWPQPYPTWNQHQPNPNLTATVYLFKKNTVYSQTTMVAMKYISLGCHNVIFTVLLIISMPIELLQNLRMNLLHHILILPSSHICTSPGSCIAILYLSTWCSDFSTCWLLFLSPVPDLPACCVPLGFVCHPVSRPWP